MASDGWPILNRDEIKMKYRIRQCNLATRYWRLVALRRNGTEIEDPSYRFDSPRLGNLVRKAEEWGADRVELVIQGPRSSK